MRCARGRRARDDAALRILAGRGRADGGSRARRGRAERQQGIERDSSALRHSRVVTARRREGAAFRTRRSANHARRRHRHQGAGVPHAGKEPRGRAGAARHADSQRGRHAAQAGRDATDACVEGAPACREGAAQRGEIRARQSRRMTVAGSRFCRGKCRARNGRDARATPGGGR
ncbi:hypothetical protein DO73_4983 [Burkholderia pseudomallei]|nr:hypothetical protein DO73_4983 [Burkholderia pseudomallei]